MQLYRGSDVVVRTPDVSHSRKELDFGPGFYTTANLEQAVRFSKKVAMKRNGHPVVNIYDLDDTSLADLEIKVFEGPDRGWLDFVIANRRGRWTGPAYDMIIGPVANDDVYGTISLFESGFYSEEEALDHLRIKRSFDQYVFVSEKAVRHIVFKGVLDDGE